MAESLNTKERRECISELSDHMWFYVLWFLVDQHPYVLMSYIIFKVSKLNM